MSSIIFPSQCDMVIKSLIKIGYQKNKKSLVINCNVNPGYTDNVRKQLEPLNYKTSFNPEWVAQGTIVRNQTNPDVIVIGEHRRQHNLGCFFFNRTCFTNLLVDWTISNCI